jgi:hypothetical protein
VAVQQSWLRLPQGLKRLLDASAARSVDGTVLFCKDGFSRLAGVAGPEQRVIPPVPAAGTGSIGGGGGIPTDD